MSALQELQKAVGLRTTDPRTLAEAASKLSDREWDDKLSEPTQKWVNAFLMERDLAVKEERDPNYPVLEGEASEGNGSTENEGFTETEQQPESRRYRATAPGKTASGKGKGRAKVKASGKGRPKSEETKKKIAAAMRKRHAAARLGKVATKAPAKAKAAKAAAPVRVAKNGGQYVIVAKPGGAFSVERVETTTTPVGVFFDKVLAEKFITAIK